jgi:Protein of unknown function (DUF2939)
VRKRWIVGALVLACAAYWFWPYAGAYELARAAEQRDAATVAERIDFTGLRHSLARQVIRSYLRQSGRDDKLGAYGRGMAVSLGTTVADPYLEQLLNPDTMTALLGAGQLKPITVENRTFSFDQPLPTLPHALSGDLLPVIFGSGYDGLSTFVLNVPATSGRSESYGVHLRRDGLTWRLAGLDLPASLVDRITADIVAREKASQGS